MMGAGEKDGTFRDVSNLSLSLKLASKYKAMNVDTTSAHSFKVITRLKIYFCRIDGENRC
jgi:hypothetical protein